MNEPKKYVNDKTADVLRAAEENVGKWVYYLSSEGVERGLDYGFARDAMRELGNYYGKTTFKDCGTAEALAEQLMNREMEIGHEAEIEGLTEEGFTLKIHYCPMLNMWNKITDDQEKIRNLCGVACTMYEGLAEQTGFKAEKCSGIALGGCCCKLVFKKQ